MLRIPRTALGPPVITPVDAGDAKLFEQRFRDALGMALRAKAMGVGLAEIRVGLGATPEQGWLLVAVKGDGSSVRAHMGIDTVLALGTAQEGQGWTKEEEHEAWVDACVEHAWTLLLDRLEPSPEMSEHDQVFKHGVLGDPGDMASIELHPDFANKIGDLAGELQQQITGRRL